MAEISRRRFLAVSGEVSLVAATNATGLFHLAGSAAAAAPVTRVDAVPTNVTRSWIAPQYWANRLQDWQLRAGRIECLTANAGGRTVSVLTRKVAPGDMSGTITMRTGTLAAGTGCSGFLIGAGGGALDWRAAALVMGASGQGGGLLAVYDSDGQVRFREHTDEANQFAFAALTSTARRGTHPARTLKEDVVLQLDITSTGAGRFDLTLTATKTSNGALLSTTKRVGVADAEIIGGLSLISTTTGTGTTARHWMRDLQTGGPKIAVQDHAVGPVLGTLYSLTDAVAGPTAADGSVLKLSAQLLPIGATDPQQVALQVRAPGTTAWSTAQTVTVGAGWCAVFRIPNWDGTRDWEYQVAYAPGTPQQHLYTGLVRRSPTADRRLSIAMINCTIHGFRNLDLATSPTAGLPGETSLGLYTTKNLYYPYAETVAALANADPDMIVALGDQYYDDRPTVMDTVHPELDVVFRYSLWLLSFRELTRSTPTICLVDDHDVYHPNLFGWSGRAAPNGSYNAGGYIMSPSWVNLVQRIQCAHNPDAYDPTPVLQGISVYYAAFTYGGVSFAVLEDRKFKNTNKSGTDEFGVPLVGPRDLLGARQESFLTAWAGMHPGQPKICLTQTVFASVQTKPDGTRMFDADSNGTPVNGRRTAVTLLKQARALVLSGDQHLATLVRHGIDTFTDGPVQFTAPATGSSWQRWFQPATTLPNSIGPNTGDFTDAYGSKLRVLAVANPKITFAQMRAVQTHNHVGDRNLKREGYGIVEVDLTSSVHRLHCWSWDQDPTTAGATEFPGWPYTLPFASV